MRSVRVTNVGKIDVLAMIIPSKVGGFNSEYYPPFDSNEASSTAEAWCAGTDVPPKTIQMSASMAKKKPKQTGLNRLKTGKKETSAAAQEDSKEDVEGLRA